MNTQHSSRTKKRNERYLTFAEMKKLTGMRKKELEALWFTEAAFPRPVMLRGTGYRWPLSGVVAYICLAMKPGVFK